MYDDLPPCVADWERRMAQRPVNVPLAVWQGAVALASVRHPNATWPTPQDQADALTVLAAAAPLVL